MQAHYVFTLRGARRNGTEVWLLTNKYIADVADGIVKKYKTRDPFSIIKCTGIILKYSDKYNKLKGYYFNTNRCDFIVVNALLDSDSAKIIAAHELGHYYLHKEEAKNAAIGDSSLFSSSSKREYEANTFCAEVLLADEKVVSAAGRCGGDFYKTASFLRVMPELALFKLNSMNSRGHNFSLPFSPGSSFLRE